MKNEQNAPKIRFKGFTDAWEQREVSDVAEITAGGTPSTSVKEYWNPKQVPWLSSGEVHKKYITYTDDKISEEGLNHSSARMIKENSVLIALAGQGKTRGTVAINRIPLSTNQSIAAMTFTSEICPEFIFSNLENRYDELRRISSGDGTRGGLNKQLVGDVIIPYTFLKEQQAIGKFFTNLDHLITLHQRKCETLKKLKKSMLQKMFPKNGSHFPEIRFAGFTDAWELRKFSDLCSMFTDGDWIEAKDQSTEGVRLIQTGNVGVTQYLDKPNNAKWISEDTFSRLKCEEIFEGDILISRLPDPAGRACIMPNLGTKMITAVDCTIVRTLPDVNSEYLVQYLSTERYFKEINACLAGGTRQRVSRGNLAEFDIPLPNSSDEQRQIGTYFRNLDHLITLHQRKLETLKKLKKAMLQKMFI